MSPSLPSVLFVCHANICRSPTAEAVFRAKAQATGLDCKIDSAGTNQRHTGILPDKRSVDVATARGYDFDGISSRKITEEDFVNFDYIVPMDMKNVDSLKNLGPKEQHHKIKLLMQYADDNIRSRAIEVPDPFLGASHGFTIVLTLIEYATDGLIKYIQEQVSTKA